MQDDVMATSFDPSDDLQQSPEFSQQQQRQQQSNDKKFKTRGLIIYGWNSNRRNKKRKRRLNRAIPISTRVSNQYCSTVWLAMIMLMFEEVVGFGLRSISHGRTSSMLLLSSSSRHHRASSTVFGKAVHLFSNQQNDDFLTTQVDELVNELLERGSLGDGSSTNDQDWMNLNDEDVQRVVDRSSKLGTLYDKPPSPVEQRNIRGQRVWWKRDDLLKLRGSNISGNKARKMWTLNQWAVVTDPENTTVNEDTDSPIPPFPECIVSYGGPQSNAMLALAAIVNYKNRQRELIRSSESSPESQDDDEDGEGKTTQEAGDDLDRRQPYRFVYYTKKLPRFLRNQPSGNLFRSRSLGMDLCELSHDDFNRVFAHAEDGTNRALEELSPPIASGKSLFVPQGGAFAAAQDGAFKLAREVYDFWKNSDFSDLSLSVCIPGGTCSTALLVHHGLKRLIAEAYDSAEIAGTRSKKLLCPTANQWILKSSSFRVWVMSCMHDDR